MKYFFRILPVLAVFVLFPSCSGRINAQLAQDGSGSVQLQAGLEPNMTALIRSFRSFAGSQSGPLLDAVSLNRSLQAAPGIASSALRNSGQEKIEGTVGISRIGDLLNTGANRFINYEAPSGNTPGRMGIHLDRSIAPRILVQISPEAVDYLSALMAPAATGEALSRAEYLLMVESVYGKARASEIAAARVTAAIAFPGTVKSVKGGTSSGREARFDIPLVDLLVLEQPLDYEITWSR
jgi:hypothetical protein